MPRRVSQSTSLTPEFDRFVRVQVASGRYQTASEVIRDGLRLLRELSPLHPRTASMNDGAERGGNIWPVGGGTMGALIRANDWSRTPLGPTESWPQSLKTAVDIMLNTRHPMFIVWGSEHICLYNDDCSASLGSEMHPSALGARGSVVWSEVWHIIGPLLERVMAGGEPIGHEDHRAPIVRQGRREEAHWSWSLSPLFDDDALDGVGGVLAIGTETTQAAVARRTSEQRFQALMEAGSEVLYRMSPDWAEMRQLSGGGVIADTVNLKRGWLGDYIHPDDQPSVLAAIRKAIRTKSIFELEHRVRRLDGSLGWVLSRAVPILGSDGEVAEWFGAASDVTARKEAEAALRTSEERYRGLVETQADLIVRIGANDRFNFVNDTGCRLLGHSRDELRNLCWHAFVHPDDHGVILGAIEKTRTAPDHRAAVEARILTVDGVRWYAWDGYAILDETGQFIEKQSVGRDITERKAMEDALRHAKDEAERARHDAEQATLAKSKFLAAASHDLRQPMQSLLLFLDVLKPQVAPDGREALTHLGRGLDALCDLLDSLFDISRLDAGIVQPVLEDFALGAVVEQIGNAYAPIALAKGLDLRITPCEAVVRSDRTLLGRMLRNLIENALRYTEAGRIAIRCTETAGRLQIEVADTGIGIPSEHLKRIWEEFHQVGNSERDRNRGLGLGLAIVQRLASLLDHPVEVRSTLGRGSVFSIEVPLGRAEPRQATDVEVTSEAAGNGCFAVLVDDDAIVLLGLKATFEAWGYEALAAGSAERALAALRAKGRRPDIVVADYRLRDGRTGVEAILRVREAYGADIPGIILTGDVGAEVQLDASEHALGIIHKPVTPRQLSMALGSLQHGSEESSGLL